MPDSRSETSRRRRRFAIVAVLLLVWTILLAPYARALWWWHVHTEAPTQLVIPVAGHAPAQLSPSFGAPRSYGSHEGIDIVADGGAPVVAAAAGIVIGNRQTQVGGTVLWILGSGRRLYYYAHLRELAPGMHLGAAIAAGAPIGSVGNTGNARDTVPHLHFAIYAVTSDFYPMEYEAIDPYPLLRAAAAE
jgi:murein DD-endopeptidase MepM/ murein hydrolase activator NlpD